MLASPHRGRRYALTLHSPADKPAEYAARLELTFETWYVGAAALTWDTVFLDMSVGWTMTCMQAAALFQHHHAIVYCLHLCPAPLLSLAVSRFSNEQQKPGRQEHRC